LLHYGSINKEEAKDKIGKQHSEKQIE